uniref:Gnk2-homologous domain-containing protein n=1 Tax=Kalanchoe fedtschenkoi TaxID=63787 RepID=A0A7N0TQB5_KALFE
MKFSFHPLLAVLAPLLLAIVSPSSSQTDETYVGHVCFDTSNSTSRANLHSVASLLSSQEGVGNGFYRFSNGENVEDPVNAYALCRGDISESACRSCVTFATSDLLQRCPTQAEEAIAWYDNCMLRYSTSHNFSYVFPLDNMYTTGDLLRRPVVSPSVLDAYFDARDDLLSTLAKRASLGDSTRKFATGNISFTTSDRIYALVQCVPDLKEAECPKCLHDQAADMPFPLLQQLRALATACDLRLAPAQFYDDIVGNAPVPSNDVIVPKDKSHPYIAVIIVVMSVCFILLVASICIFLYLMRRKEKLQNKNYLGNTTAPSPPSLQAIRVDGDEQRQAGRGARSAANSVTPIMEMPMVAAQRSETGVSSNTLDGTSMSWILKTPLTHPAPR